MKKYGNSKCFIITKEEREKRLKDIKDRSCHLLSGRTGRTLVIGAIIGVSLYSSPLEAGQIAPGKAGIVMEETVVASAFNEGYERVYELSDGMAKVKVNGKYGFLNEWGNLSIPPEFDDANKFSEGFAGVKIAEKWGYIDKSGKIIIEPQFELAGNFSEGLAFVMIEGKYGYIDKAGKIVIKPKLDMAEDFRDGKALVQVAGKHAYIDKKGKYLNFGDIDFEATPEPTPQVENCLTCTGGCINACTSYVGCGGCTKCTGCTVCTGCTGICTSGCTTGCIMCTSCTGYTCGYCTSYTCGYCTGYTSSPF